MASAVVGALRVILSADTAEFKSGLDQATKLTGDFSGKLTGLQAQVQGFSKVFGTMFTVGALAAAAKQVLDYAGKIQDLGEQTGLTVEAIQEMGFAAKQTGSSLESFTNAAFKLGTNLASGTTAVRDAVQALGLSYQQLNASSPDEQFRQTAIALSKVEDVQERNRLGVILMGKAYKDVAGAINSGYDELARRAGISSAAQIKALSDAGDAWDELTSRMMAWGVMAGGSFATSMKALGAALKQDAELIEEWTGFVRLNTQAMEDWHSIFLKAGEGPKVVATAVKNLPEPLQALTMSTEQVAAAEKKLTEQVEKKIEANKKALKLQEEMREAQERFAASMQRLDTAEFFVPFKKSVEEANFELEELESRIPDIAQAFVRFKEPVQEATREVETWGDVVRDTMIELPNVILSAITGGGDAIAAAGAWIGKSLMSKFQATFGPIIEAALPFGIGKAITALLPTLGTLFGPIAKKLAGFFRNIFGGPEAEEEAGRERVADFEDDLHSLLNQTQLNEAGNEDWKKTVIAIRDAYLEAGKTEEEAMKAAERLWQSSKKGAAETEAAIAAIQAVLDQAKHATDELGASMDYAFRDRTVNHGYDGAEQPGFAGGTMGRLGKWFGNFGAGMDATLHGMEAVVRPDQAVPFAADVLSGLAAGAPSAVGGGVASPTIINNSFAFDVSTLDTDELSRLVRRRVIPEINAQLSNVGDLRSGMRDGLGI